MLNLILAIHIMACLLLIGLVLLQKSEGGGLGMGGGGANSILSGRGAAGAIVRTTMIVGGIFVATSLGLTALAQRQAGVKSAVEREIEAQNAADDLIPATPVAPAPTTGGLIDPSASPSAVPPASGSASSSISIPITETPEPATPAPATPDMEAPPVNPPLQETPATGTPQ